MRLEKIMTLADVRKNIIETGGRIISENPVSTGKCRECKDGNWELERSQKIMGEEVCEYYSCKNSNCKFRLVSSISFNVKYNSE